MAALVLALLPYVVSPVVMYPDEPQYVNAGLVILQTQDWLRPAQPTDDGPKYRKPILTYWIVAVSYQLLGSSIAAARLPYLLAGVGIVWLTYRLVLMLTDAAPEGRIAATLAAALMLANPMLWFSSTRCVPDIFLCLFLLISTHGFLALLTLERPGTQHALMAYLGVALAFLTKGLPAVVFLATWAAVGCVNPVQRHNWRRLIHVPIILGAGACAASWFALMVALYGTESLSNLWDDQVATRGQRNPWIWSGRLMIAADTLILVGFSLWWICRRIGIHRRHTAPQSEREELAFAFVAVWTFVSLLTMCSAVDWYFRYLLPVFPLQAAVLGLMLSRLDGAILRRWTQRVLLAMLMLASITALTAFAMAMQFRLTAIDVLASVGTVLIIALLALIGLRGSWLTKACTSALAGLLVMPIAFTSIQHVVRPDLEAAILDVLHAEGVVPGLRCAAFIGGKGPACRLRTQLPATVKLLQWESLPARDSSDDPGVLILPTDNAGQLPADRYLVRPAGSLFEGPPQRQLIQAMAGMHLNECLLQHRREYCVALRRTTPLATSRSP